jgi:hypothetical protein
MTRDRPLWYHRARIARFQRWFNAAPRAFQAVILAIIQTLMLIGLLAVLGIRDYGAILILFTLGVLFQSLFIYRGLRRIDGEAHGAPLDDV